MDAETQNIFLLGLVVLFGWMIVVLVCASPQLFRNYIRQRCCCFDKDRLLSEQKIKAAEARLQATLALAEKPSSFLIGQVVALSNIDSCNDCVLSRSTHSSFRECEEGSVFQEERPLQCSA